MSQKLETAKSCTFGETCGFSYAWQCSKGKPKADLIAAMLALVEEAASGGELRIAKDGLP